MRLARSSARQDMTQQEGCNGRAPASPLPRWRCLTTHILRHAHAKILSDVAPCLWLSTSSHIEPLASAERPETQTKRDAPTSSGRPLLDVRPKAKRPTAAPLISGLVRRHGSRARAANGAGWRTAAIGKALRVGASWTVRFKSDLRRALSAKFEPAGAHFSSRCNPCASCLSRSCWPVPKSG